MERQGHARAGAAVRAAAAAAVIAVALAAITAGRVRKLSGLLGLRDSNLALTTGNTTSLQGSVKGQVT